MTNTSGALSAVPRAPLRQGPFRRYLLGLAADLVGDQVWFITLAWAAARATEPATAGLIVGVGTIPRMLALLPAGAIVDRFGALRVAQTAQLLRIATMLAAVVVALARPTSVPLLTTLALVFGLADSLRLPAAGALPPALLSAEALTEAQGLVSTVGRVASVIAGPVAGVALAAGGLTMGVAINVVLFAAAFGVFATLRSHITISRPHPSGAGSGMIAGLRYVARQRPIMLMLAMTTALNLALVGPLNLGVVFRVEHHDWSPAALGVIIGAFGVAAALGALSLTVFRPRQRPIVAGFAWSAVSAIAIAILGYTPTITTSAAVAAIAGFALGPAGALLLGQVQATTAPDYLGRVMSLVSFSSFGLTPVGLAGFGYLVRATELPLAFLITGATVAVLAMVGAIRLRHLRPTTLPDDKAAT